MGIFGRRPSKPPPPPAAVSRDTKTPVIPMATDDPLSPFWSRPPETSVPVPREPSVAPPPAQRVAPRDPSPPAPPSSPPFTPNASDPPPVQEQLARVREATPTAPEQLRHVRKDRAPENEAPSREGRGRQAPQSIPPSRWVPPSPQSSAPPRMSPVPARASSIPIRPASPHPDRASSSNPPKSTNVPQASDPVAMMKLARANSDHHTALTMAEAILAREPGHVTALSCAAESRDRLMDGYDRKLGPRYRMVRVMVGLDEVQRLGLDPRAAFVLSRIDGTSTIEEIIDMSGMPALEAMRLLADIFDRGLAVAEDPPPPSRMPR
jgi:hypothetical protein